MDDVVTRLLEPTAANLKIAAEALRAGQLVAFPTETVYGLGANALDAQAVRKIFAAKGRPAFNPIIVHVGDLNVVHQVAAEWPELAERLAQRFWPGPLTLVLPKQSTIPDEVTAGLGTVGIRIPRHPVALEFLHKANVPVAAPSANRSTEVSPTTATHVFAGLQGRIDFIIDGGPCPSGIESTVLDMTTKPPRILRPGPVTQFELQELVGPVEMATTVAADQPLPAPGMMVRHYAPRHPLELAEDDDHLRVKALVEQGQRVAWLTWANVLNVGGCHPIDMPATPIEYAKRLYAALREADQLPIDRIVVSLPPNEPEWFAVRDRLTRAATK